MTNKLEVNASDFAMHLMNVIVLYAMVQIEVDMVDDLIVDDVPFTKLLLEEENIVVLPRCVFGLGGDDKTKENWMVDNDDAR